MTRPGPRNGSGRPPEATSTGFSGRVSGRPGVRPHAEIIGEVAKSRRPASTLARCRSISSCGRRGRPASSRSRDLVDRGPFEQGARRAGSPGRRRRRPTSTSPASRRARGRVRPKARSAPRPARRSRKSRRSLLASTCSGPTRRCRSAAGAPGRRPPPAASPGSEHADHGRQRLRPRGARGPGRAGRGRGRRDPAGGASAPDVVAADLEAGPARTGHPRHVDVGGQHRARRARPGRPSTPATLGPAGAHLPAVPAPARCPAARCGGRCTGRTATTGRRAGGRPRPGRCRGGSRRPRPTCRHRPRTDGRAEPPSGQHPPAEVPQAQAEEEWRGSRTSTG